jgi:hypothetical protein
VYWCIIYCYMFRHFKMPSSGSPIWTCWDGAQCSKKQKRMGAVYCDRRRVPSFSAFHEFVGLLLVVRKCMVHTAQSKLVLWQEILEGNKSLNVLFCNFCKPRFWLKRVKRSRCFQFFLILLFDCFYGSAPRISRDCPLWQGWKWIIHESEWRR